MFSSPVSPLPRHLLLLHTLLTTTCPSSLVAGGGTTTYSSPATSSAAAGHLPRHAHIPLSHHLPLLSPPLPQFLPFLGVSLPSPAALFLQPLLTTAVADLILTLRPPFSIHRRPHPPGPHLTVAVLFLPKSAGIIYSPSRSSVVGCHCGCIAVHYHGRTVLFANRVPLLLSPPILSSTIPCQAPHISLTASVSAAAATSCRCRLLWPVPLLTKPLPSSPFLPPSMLALPPSHARPAADSSSSAAGCCRLSPQLDLLIHLPFSASPIPTLLFPHRAAITAAPRELTAAVVRIT